MKQEHCNIPSMLYSRCSSRALGNLLHQCTSAATWAAYQYLWVVFKQNFTNSEKSELVSLACIQLDEGEWGNLTEVKWFAWPLRVNVAYGTSCRQAHCHSASSNSSLDIPTSHPHRKFVWGKARVKVKSKTLEFWSSIAAQLCWGWTAVLVWDGGSPSLVSLHRLRCCSSIPQACTTCKHFSATLFTTDQRFVMPVLHTAFLSLKQLSYLIIYIRWLVNKS